ncbi:MAG: hypothetical protein WCK03_03210 [Candidatus Taylorbacteria bacterium]
MKSKLFASMLVVFAIVGVVVLQSPTKSIAEVISSKGTGVTLKIDEVRQSTSMSTGDKPYELKDYSHIKMSFMKGKKNFGEGEDITTIFKTTDTFNGGGPYSLTINKDEFFSAPQQPNKSNGIIITQTVFYGGKTTTTESIVPTLLSENAYPVGEFGSTGEVSYVDELPDDGINPVTYKASKSITGNSSMRIDGIAAPGTLVNLPITVKELEFVWDPELGFILSEKRVMPCSSIDGAKLDTNGKCFIQKIVADDGLQWIFLPPKMVGTSGSGYYSYQVGALTTDSVMPAIPETTTYPKSSANTPYLAFGMTPDASGNIQEKAAIGSPISVSWNATGMSSCKLSDPDQNNIFSKYINSSRTGEAGTSGNINIAYLTAQQFNTLPTTLTISCSGSGISIAKSITISSERNGYPLPVMPITASSTLMASSTRARPTVTLTATPNLITANQSSLISWTSTNATSCSSVPPSTSGSFSIPASSITSTGQVSKTLFISCTGPGGSASSTVTVRVSGVIDSQANAQANVQAQATAQANALALARARALAQSQADALARARALSLAQQNQQQNNYTLAPVQTAADTAALAAAQVQAAADAQSQAAIQAAIQARAVKLVLSAAPSSSNTVNGTVSISGNNITITSNNDGLDWPGVTISWPASIQGGSACTFEGTLVAKAGGQFNFDPSTKSYTSINYMNQDAGQSTLYLRCGNLQSNTFNISAVTSASQDSQDAAYAPTYSTASVWDAIRSALVKYYNEGGN